MPEPAPADPARHAVPAASNHPAGQAWHPLPPQHHQPPHPPLHPLSPHSDEELGAALGAPVVRRREIHAWTLSRVESVELADGTRWAYKAQVGPTVEVEFYAAARSALLLPHRILPPVGGTRALALAWTGAPLLSALPPDRELLLRHGRELVREIGDVAPAGDGPLPVFLDIGTPAAWAGVVDGVLERWQRLLADGLFTRTTSTDLARVREWAASAPVLGAVAAEPRLVHGDLKPDQVFLTADGHRVIDWQRPMIAPPGVDLACLLAESGHDPLGAVPAPVVGIFRFVRLHWSVTTQHDLWGGDRREILDIWARQAVDGILR